ncbi:MULTISPECIES: RNA 2'-phosphotransferase [Amycolatopsis]|uniref:Probable RNA 2'-phosphotransferase n=2 Tax=Amycolatopsis TaxID=1813 RepID=A0A1I3WIP6_9PSEU|nr:RNA 2'-phosphotransferase [Amycolatopsis sacchari]SFK06727.1 putative RNA 2'-phosphotransferase [Amycolatopsis sacchari]
MDNRQMVKLSKRLARHLRHDPAALGITLGPGGWVEVRSLLAALRGDGVRITRADLEEVVAGNDKQRFAFDATGERIRANQGHSVEIDLGLPATTPPAVLYHGTVERFLSAIFHEGLRPMNRHDVHLSPDRETAVRVGSRRGKPVVLEVDAGAMSREGHEFRVSANGVWLTAAVPPEFLRRIG